MQIWSGMRPVGDAEWKMNEDILNEPASVLRAGGLIAFPTETVYGLGANAWNEQAVQNIFAAKRRPADNPLIVHIAKISDLAMVTPKTFTASVTMQKLMAQFWPGPLTILVPAGSQIAPSVHPGLAMVGVRVPDHPIARALIALAGCPVAAPSANRSGKPSPTSVADVVEDFADEVAGVIDGGQCAVGMESTVIEVQPEQIVIYRPGGVTLEALQAVVDIPVIYDKYLLAETRSTALEMNESEDDRPENGVTGPKAPGMKYRHYAPNAEVTVWQGSRRGVMARITKELQQQSLASRSSVGIVCPDTWAADFEDLNQDLTVAHSVDSRGDSAQNGRTIECVLLPQSSYAQELGRQLYGQLRTFDRMGIQTVWIVAPPAADNFTPTVMNRLIKASEGRVIYVE